MLKQNPVRKFPYLALAIFGLGGCMETIGGVVTNTATGAVAGAVIANQGAQKRNALVGSVIGNPSSTQAPNPEPTDASLAYEQSVEIKKLLAGTGAEVSTNGARIRVIVPAQMSFAANSAVLKTSASGTLAALAHNLNDHPDSIVQIIGYTDNSSSTKESQKLSKSRADAMARRLEQNGVSKLRLQTLGLGSGNPIAYNQDDHGRRANNRVEINIIRVSE